MTHSETMKTAFLSALLATAVSISALATEEILFPEKTRVQVSAEGLNALVAENGVIGNAVSNENELELSRKDGGIYFRVLAKDKLIPLFVEVKSDSNKKLLYTLLLDPVEELAAERIVIRGIPEEPHEGVFPVKSHSRPEPRLRRIKELLLAMARNWETEGFRKEKPSATTISSPERGTREELVSLYRGIAMHGEIWRLGNQGGQEIRIGRMDFSNRSSIIAVAAEVESLTPGEETLLYVIRETDPDE